MATSALNSGAAVQCPNNECSRFNPNARGGLGGYEYFQASADGWSGYLPGGISYVGDGLLLNGIWTDSGKSEAIRFSDGEAGFTPMYFSPPATQDKKRRKRPQPTPQGGNGQPSEQKKGDPLVRYLPATGSYDSAGEARIAQTLQDIMVSGKCAQAFLKYGLMPIANLVFGKGVVIGPATLLLQSANNEMVGITEYARNRDVEYVSMPGVQAFTIRNHPNHDPDTLDARARIFLTSSALDGLGKYSLREVLVHEFLHVAGWEAKKVGVIRSIFGSTDLSHKEGYDEIMKACK